MATLKKIVGNNELGSVKETRTVIEEKVNLVHTHDAKCAALELKYKTAEAAKKKHKEALEEAIRLQKERHANALKANQAVFARFINYE